jgi:hypothetical protein
MRAPNRLGTSFDVEFGENVFHVRLRRDIDFEVIDDQPVDVVFLFCSLNLLTTNSSMRSHAPPALCETQKH